ncbi:mitochondrial transcription factor B2 [Arctopsyche grandis]|uniref:mitochondrial transcription factor B2 n=1 Tax=Arctopsyche grandis TaxID=121162 RepID=UPI00406D9A03
MKRLFTSVCGATKQSRVGRVGGVEGVSGVKLEGAEPLLNNLLRMRRSTPEVLYVASESAAKRLISHLKPCLEKSTPENLLEINPGFGYLTKELLDLHFPKINLYETSSNYEQFLMKLQKQYPNRLQYKIEDFFGMWRMSFLDKLDSGNRIEKLFDSIETKPWESECIITGIGCTPSLSFVKHLIMSIIFQNSLISLGRPEFYLLMSPLDYISLKIVDENTVNYRATPVVFNTLFEHQMITKLPRKDYLPQHVIKPTKVNTKKAELINSEKDYIYLVHICAKEKLPCPKENLPLFWYFCKHHLRNREYRIIPKLEEWIPGCGIWLITEQNPPGTSLQTLPNENDEKLPHITIFTQFQDLSVGQKLTLFKKFISWPEFEQSPFRDTLENHIHKQYNNYDIDVKEENIETEEESQES